MLMEAPVNKTTCPHASNAIGDDVVHTSETDIRRHATTVTCTQWDGMSAASVEWSDGRNQIERQREKERGHIWEAWSFAGLIFSCLLRHICH